MYAEPDRMVGTPIGGFPGDLLKPRLDYFGVGYDDYDRVIRFGPIVVVEADVGGSAVAETLSSNGYRSTGSYGGYELFGRTDIQRTVAVEEQRLLFSRGRESEANVTAVIDAEMGDVDRYHETDDSFATLSASVGSHPFSWLGRGTVSDQALTAGFSVTAEGDTVYYVLDELYPDGQTPSEAGFKERLNEDPRAVESAAVDVEMDGRVASATMEMSGEQYREVNGIETRSPSHPQITWGIDHVEDDGTVVIRHEAGESVDAGQVEVRFGGIQDGSLADEQFSARYDRVDPGDELRVDLDGRPAGAPLVVWHAAPDGGAALLVYDFN